MEDMKTLMAAFFRAFKKLSDIWERVGSGANESDLSEAQLCTLAVCSDAATILIYLTRSIGILPTDAGEAAGFLLSVPVNTSFVVTTTTRLADSSPDGVRGAAVRLFLAGSLGPDAAKASGILSGFIEELLPVRRDAEAVAELCMRLSSHEPPILLGAPATRKRGKARRSVRRRKDQDT